MKKYIVSIMLALTVAPIFSPMSARELTTKEVVDQTRKKVKADKRGKAEAKEKKAAGWLVFEGSNPMELQMANQIAYTEATDAEGMPYFYQGPGTFTSNNKAAALKYATKNAILDIAQQIDVSVASSSDMEDETEGAGEYVGTVTKNRTTSSDDITARLAGLQPTVKIYKKNGGLYEVNVIVFYSRAKAAQLAAETRGKAYEGNPELKEKVRERLEALKEQ